MAENTARPTAAKAYQTPADTGTRTASTYRDPGVPAPRDPAQSLGVRQNAQAHTTEPVQAPPTQTHPVGSQVQHAISGQHGVVVNHRSHGYGQAVPEVQWAGEDKSWPQGVSANALRVVGSTPNDLYLADQGADGSRPTNRNTGAA